MAGSESRSLARRARAALVRPRVACAILAAIVIALWSATPAIAGQASSGELLFYPCTSCHPVTLQPGTDKPTRKLPGDFPGHEIVLVGHDVLGEGDAACLVCHDDPAKDPGKLKLIDGSLIDITGDTAKVCYRCHSAKYNEWMAGTHGKHKPTCTAAGCHDPHSPRWIYAESLPPFVGSGFQFKALSGREPFTPLAPPAPAPPTEVPQLFLIAVVLGVVAAAARVAGLVRGRPNR
ncbi:MAG: cytochrome c3 family protein [Actinomycetota bacterium]|nr:cytochrome c3 family protein [Actinomycetota bacterium]